MENKVRIKDHLKLCLVTKTTINTFDVYKKFLLQAVEGGVTLVQLREKFKNPTELKSIALELKSILKVPLIINDNIEIAKEIDADGVHLGQSDSSPILARELLGPKKIIGLSIETLPQLTIANQLTCINYIAASAVFPSKNKSDCKTIWGLDGLQKITQLSKHPVVAIGGIDQHNIQQIIENGASGAAVIGAIHDQDDPKTAARNLLKKINQQLERNKTCIKD